MILELNFELFNRTLRNTLLKVMDLYSTLMVQGTILLKTLAKQIVLFGYKELLSSLLRNCKKRIII